MLNINIRDKVHIDPMSLFPIVNPSSTLYQGTLHDMAHFYVIIHVLRYSMYAVLA